MELTLGFLCDWANRTEDGKVNSFGMFEQINAVRAPFKHPRFCIVTRIGCKSLDYGTPHTLKIRLIGPDGQVVHQLPPRRIEVAAQTKAPLFRVNEILVLNGMEFPVFGDYAFELSFNEESPYVIPLTINHFKK